MPTFLQIEGVKGPVVEENHKEWIGIDTYGFGISNPPQGDQHRDGRLTAGGSKFTDLMISKVLDNASPLIAKMAAIGTPIQSVKLEVVETINQKDRTVAKVTLENSIVSDYSLHGMGDAMRGENVTFAFSKIAMEFTPYDEQGNAGAPAKFEYNLNTRQ